MMERSDGGSGPPTYYVENPRTRLNVTGRCPHCGGNMWDFDCPGMDPDIQQGTVTGTLACRLCGRTAAYVVVGRARRPLPPDEYRPRRGRPPRMVTEWRP